MKVVLDSNVLISVVNRNDCMHPEASELIKKLSAGKYEIVAPVLLLWEFSSYSHNAEKSKAHSNNKDLDLHITTVDVTIELFWHTHSQEMANISGADRIFISVAKNENAPLITNDGRILRDAERLGVKAISTSSFLADHLNESPRDNEAAPSL